MRQEIRASTSSMTSVPKPLKFLRPHYGTLKAFHQTMPASDLKKCLSDILSVLALTMSAEGQRESLSYRLIGTEGDIGSWGHEYSEEAPIDDLMELVQQIVAFHMKHNAETEAVDLLMDVEDLDLLLEHVDKTNFKRTCNYLTSAAKYLPGPDDMLVLDISYMIYMKFEEYPNALHIALFLDNTQYVKQVFTSCADLLRKKQFCYMIARHGITFELDDEMVADEDDREALQDIVNNTKLSEGYLTLARDIEVMEAKTPEDIYKAHLLDGRASSGASVDSARQNLAATFVNAFVNAGFGQDKLMTVPSDSTTGSSGNWLFKNKEHGKISAAASLVCLFLPVEFLDCVQIMKGMIQLWDVEGGLAQLDKYFHSNDNPILSGALLGVGIVNCGIKSDCDPIRSKLSLILNDAKAPLDVIAFASLSLGMIYVGSCNEEVAQSIIFALMDRSEAELGDALTRFLPLGLGLLYLGKQVGTSTCSDIYQESVEAMAEVSKTFNEKIRKYCDMTLLSCAYAGTGNVLKVQDLLAQCGEHLEKGDIHQGPAVLGLSMVAMSEELGIDMEIRSLERMLQYGEQNIRRAVPLALGLLCISNPKVTVMDTLSRPSHDTDSEVAMVRIAQGLVHMGKGLLTLTPFHSERFLLSPKVHDEIQKMKIDMMKQFINLGETINHLAEIVREMKAGDGRVNGGTASQPATRIMKGAADLQVPEESMELYDWIYGAPIFDVYDDEEPSYDVFDDAVPINGDEDSSFLGFEYIEKNIQAMDSKIVEDSSFAPLPNKDIFKEFIDVSHIEAVITRIWIQSVAHKTYGRSITAPTHPIQSHELPTSKPKMLNEEQPVPGKPPPLRDKKFTPSCVFRKGVLATSHSPPLRHNAILLIKPERVFQSRLVRQESYVESEKLPYFVSNLEDKVVWRNGVLIRYNLEKNMTTALAGIVTLLHACLNMKPIILGKYHYVLYFLVLAMQPRMMLTVDKDLKPLSVPVRVGQAVDVVGQAGRPKTITGFQTHSTPVLLAAGERAELATDKYIPLSPILEGFIILEENADYREE
ncbi:hypothetical protein BRARA_G00027 [Brassica rapa]|uniref:26S proteasome non-ATPase regulatory subunit 2 homolog n=1 Tax=Brassica campestris TaxID=3711 RepID=A0A397YKZ0_BRACM|nr:hypothetical protein BRARA_G00027 [Brassica rapa]